jgi:hypothetical protein
VLGTGDEAGDGASRQLSRNETAFWYGLAAATYIGAAIYHKFLLNWFIGPVWLVAVVWVGPALVDAVRRRRRGRP